MNHYAGACLVSASLGTLAVIGAGCSGRVLDVGSGGGGPVAVAGASTGGSDAAPTAGTTDTAMTTADAGTMAGGGSAGSASDALPANAVEVALVPSADGSVNNEFGVLGGWYPFADGNEGVNPGVCQTVGKHLTQECSVISSPVPGTPFAPTGTSHARMCTSGKVAQVIPSADSRVYAFSVIFGAGIGFDLNNPGLNTGASMKMPFDASAKMVIGVSFDLDSVPATGLRIEFPFGSASTPAGVWKPNPTWDHARNLPIWASPVNAGHNVLLFTNVAQQSFVPIDQKVPFDPSTLMSIQFHIPTNERASAAAAFEFCVDNLALVVQM